YYESLLKKRRLGLEGRGDGGCRLASRGRAGIRRAGQRAQKERGALPPPFRALRDGPASGLLLRRTPAFRVGLADDLRVRDRAHGGADLDLLVRLDRDFLRAAVLLAPDERDLAALGNVRVDDAERQHRALVV